MVANTALEATTVPRAQFCTDDLPSGERFDYWRDRLEPVVDVACDSTFPIEQFSTTVDCFNLHNLLFANGTYTPQEIRWGPEFPGGKGADAFLLRFYLDGGCEYYGGGKNTTLQPGDIGLINLAEPLTLCADSSRVLSLVIPREMMREYIQPGHLTCGTVVRADTATGAIFGNYLQSLWRQLSSVALADTDTVIQMLLGCIAGVFGKGGADDDKVGRALQHADLEYMRAYIDRHLPEPSLNVDHLCRHFGYSRAALYSLFRPLGGVAGYIRRSRLEYCRQDLERIHGTSVRICDISARWGFVNYSQFCRLFRATFGMTPREVAVNGSGGSQQNRTEHTETGKSAGLFVWIRQLSRQHSGAPWVKTKRSGPLPVRT